MGFIQKLPTQLVAAFRATLEEIEEAQLLLHVIDVSSPLAAAQSEAVEEVLKELNTEGIDVLTVWNKASRCVGFAHGFLDMYAFFLVGSAR